MAGQSGIERASDTSKDKWDNVRRFNRGGEDTDIQFTSAEPERRLGTMCYILICVIGIAALIAIGVGVYNIYNHINSKQIK